MSRGMWIIAGLLTASAAGWYFFLRKGAAVTQLVPGSKYTLTGPALDVAAMVPLGWGSDLQWTVGSTTLTGTYTGPAVGVMPQLQAVTA